jgi:hypothetical protein
MDNGYGYASFQILVFPLVLDEGTMGHTKVHVEGQNKL